MDNANNNNREINNIIGQPPASEEKVGPVSFVNVAGQAQDEFPNDAIKSFDNIGLSEADNVNVQMDSLAKFARMPVLVGSLSWSTASTSGTKLATYTFNDYLSAATGFSARLENVGAYKFDKLCFKVVCAVQPFVNGALGICTFPRVFGYNTAFTDSVYKLNQNMTTLMVVPGNESGTVSLPWAYPYTAIDRKNQIVPAGDTCNGMWNIIPFVLAPLQASAATTLDLEVYAWLEGFEVLSTTMESGKMLVSDLVGEDIKEKVTTVRKAIEVLGPLVAPQPMVDLITGVSKMAGFGNPPEENYAIQPVNGFTRNSNRPSQSLTHKCSEPGQVFEYDALDFANLACVPQLVLETTLPVGSVPGAITTVNLTPWQSSATAGAVTVTNTAPMEFIIRDFSYWRTGFRVIILVPHSKQTGRFRASYIPFRNASSAATASDKSTLPSINFSLGEVVNGEQVNCWTLDIPYCAVTPYLPSHETSWPIDPVTPWNNGRSMMGRVLIENISDITGPTTVGDVNFLVFISGKPDFACMGWNINDMALCPTLTDSQQTTLESGGNGGLYWEYNPALCMSDGRNHPLHFMSNASKTVFDFGIKSGMPAASLAQAGYPVVSYRDVVTKLLPIPKQGGSFSRTARKFNFFLTEFIDQDAVTPTGDIVIDLIARLRSIFSFESGSLVIASQPSRTGIMQKHIAVQKVRDGTALVVNQAAVFNNSPGLQTWNNFPDNPNLVSILPRYGMTPMTPLVPGTSSGALNFPVDTDAKCIPESLLYVETLTAGGTEETDLYRGGGDDYSLRFRRPVPTFGTVGTGFSY